MREYYHWGARDTDREQYQVARHDLHQPVYVFRDDGIVYHLGLAFRLLGHLFTQADLPME
jgi:hypothetical protein